MFVPGYILYNIQILVCANNLQRVPPDFPRRISQFQLKGLDDFTALPTPLTSFPSLRGRDVQFHFFFTSFGVWSPGNWTSLPTTTDHTQIQSPTHTIEEKKRERENYFLVPIKSPFLFLVLLVLKLPIWPENYLWFLAWHFCQFWHLTGLKR